jgi:60 kDa SS-A/Ro ribonucleoprotein
MLPRDQKIAVGVDVSGSMHCPCRFRPGGVTNGAAQGSVKLLDLAALFAGGLLQNTARSLLLGFDEKAWVRHCRNHGTSLLKEIAHTSGIGGSNSDCAAPLRLLNEHQEQRDLVVIISDNQTWADLRKTRESSILQQWDVFRSRNPRARLVCLDLQPEVPVPWPARQDVLCLSARCERVFPIITQFSAGGITTPEQVRQVQNLSKVPLPDAAD